MARVSFAELMTCAKRGGYAVGYFESWNLESLLAVADAAETARSPVVLGFSGIYLPHPDRVVRDPLAACAAMAAAVADALTVPACLLFNESPDRNWVMAAIDAGFDLVMFSDDSIPPEERIATIRSIAERAHQRGSAVEAELASLPGVAGDLAPGAAAGAREPTGPSEARCFIEATGADALGINVGQLHLHGRTTAPLDLDRLRALAALSVPLVLHGGSSIAPDDIRAAIAIGVRKINVGSRLKQTYFAVLRDACAATPTSANPYEVIGSGLAGDVLVAGRLAMQRDIEAMMHLFGSAGRAGR
jgi:fructose/tagatose bisphosphate aldolase